MAVGWCAKRCGTTGCSSGLAAGCCSSWCLSPSLSALELWMVSDLYLFVYVQSTGGDAFTSQWCAFLFWDYGDRGGGQSWTMPGTKVVKPAPVSSPDKRLPKPPDEVINADCHWTCCLTWPFCKKGGKTVLLTTRLWSSQPPAVSSAPDWQSVAERRIELLTAACQNSSLRNLTHVSISKFVLDRIFVCDKHKILFCQTPKVGNTQWKKVLIVLNGT